MTRDSQRNFQGMLTASIKAGLKEELIREYLSHSAKYNYNKDRQSILVTPLSHGILRFVKQT